ncbi:hypothetical protein TIFTF001_028967 [Ficus carica]|uniref:Uncharacterized protein n=1 Tax=Ficus carica TaxID=3494 RepID=A0AA88IXB6_FICCA|nr:hypothetical protein TIFTF001_028967 [Ficus carica]
MGGGNQIGVLRGRKPDWSARVVAGVGGGGGGGSTSAKMGRKHIGDLGGGALDDAEDGGGQL